MGILALTPFKIYSLTAFLLVDNERSWCRLLGIILFCTHWGLWIHGCSLWLILNNSQHNCYFHFLLFFSCLLIFLLQAIIYVNSVPPFFIPFFSLHFILGYSMTYLQNQWFYGQSTDEPSGKGCFFFFLAAWVL